MIGTRACSDSARQAANCVVVPKHRRRRGDRQNPLPPARTAPDPPARRSRTEVSSSPGQGREDAAGSTSNRLAQQPTVLHATTTARKPHSRTPRSTAGMESRRPRRRQVEKCGSKPPNPVEAARLETPARCEETPRRRRRPRGLRPTASSGGGEGDQGDRWRRGLGFVESPRVALGESDAEPIVFRSQCIP
jgi:hypothetical protein